ncbi:hypothetical protein [Amaricoccus tamworthensis]|uniref:hypothetical protein n=1 Tax=Amaricoccus tamworthensis TaxID=57002 RepID=UPI003C7A4213
MQNSSHSSTHHGLSAHAIILATLVTLPSPATAREPCPVEGPKPEVYGNTWIHVDDRTSLRLVPSHVLLIVDGREKSFKAVQQPDNGPAETIVEVTPGKYFVLGPVKSYLITLTEGDDGIELVAPVELPVRYYEECSFVDRVFWGICMEKPTEYSPALGAVVSSGYDKKGSQGTVLFRDDSIGTPLELEDGTPVIYRRDDQAGNALVVTIEYWDGYVITENGTLTCRDYLEHHPELETFPPRTDG